MPDLPRSAEREVGAVRRQCQAAGVFRLWRTSTVAFHKLRRLLPKLPAAIQRGAKAMIDVHLHFRGELPERRRLPAVPVVGAYIIGTERRLWQVSAVVFDGEAVNIYATEVSSALAGELTTAWSAWSHYGTGPCSGDVDDCSCPTCARARIARRPNKPKRPRVCETCGESSTIRPCPICAAMKAKKAKRK